MDEIHDSLDRRLARLEALVTDYTERAMENSSKLEYLQNSVDKIPEQIKDLSDSLNGRVESFQGEVASVTRKIERVDHRLQALETESEKAQKRRDFLRRISLGFLTAVAGAIVSKLIEMFSTRGPH